MNTLCIVLLVSLTGNVRSMAVNETCGTSPPVCDDGLYCSEANVCIVKVKANMTCTATPADQCITGATCVVDMCKCGENQMPSTDMTMCLLKIGENCSAAGSECMVGTTCKEQTCMCPENSGPNTAKDKCLMYVGGQCAESGDCVQGVNVVCNSSKCACTSNKYAPSDMMDMCKLKLNQTCTNVDECGMNTVCSTTCACEANYVAEENRCGMKVGGACTGDTHCVMNAECKSEKCACSGTYTSDGDYCKSGSAAVVASLLLLVAALVTSRLM